MRIAVELSSGISEELSIKSEHQRVLGAGESHVKQPLHFLSLDLFEFLIELARVGPIKQDVGFVGFHIFDRPWISRWRVADVACQERHDDRVPLRTLGLVRGDQLDRVTRRRMGLARRIKIRSQALPEICKRKSARFGRRGNAQQLV